MLLPSNQFLSSFLIILLLFSCSENKNLKISKAFKSGNISEIKKLWEQNPELKTQDSLNYRLLNSSDNYELIKFLIEEGADVNYSDEHYGTALKRLAKRDTKTLELLLAEGADINAISRGSAAIHEIADHYDLDKLKFFIEKGADINIQDQDGNTPLHLAIIKNKIDNVKILIDAKADTSIKNKKGRDAGETAKKKNKKKILSLLRRSGAAEGGPVIDVKNLIQGAPFSHQYESQYSPNGKIFIMATTDLLVFDVETRKQIKVISTNKKPIAIDFSQDSNSLAVLYKVNEDAVENPKYQAALINLNTYKEEYNCFIPELKGNLEYPDIKLSPDNKLIATYVANKILVYDWKGKETWSYEIDPNSNPNKQRGRFTVTPDWKYFLMNLQRIEYPSKKTAPIAKFNNESKPYIHSAIISSDGKKAAVSGEGNGAIFRLFDLEKGKLIKEKEVGGTDLIVGNTDLSILAGEHGVWFTESDKVYKYKPISNSVGLNAAAFSDAKNEISIASVFFSIKTAQNWKNDHRNKGDGLWFKFAATGINDNYSFTKESHQITTRSVSYDIKKKAIFDGPSKRFDGSVHSHDENYFINSSRKVIEFKDGTKINFIPKELNLSVNRGFQITKNDIVSCSAGAKALVYEVNDKKLNIVTLPSLKNAWHNYRVQASESGTYLEAINWSGVETSYVFEVKTNKLLFKNVVETNYSRLFSLDEKFYLVPNQKTIYFYNTKSWKVEKKVTLPSGGISRVVPSPDGKSILVSNTNGQGQLIDLETGKITLTLKKVGFNEIIVFGPDGKSVFSTDDVDSVFR